MSNLRHPSRLAEYSSDGSYYPRELAESNGKLYFIGNDGVARIVNPTGITNVEDASGSSIGSINPTTNDTLILPDASTSKSGLVKFSTTAPKADGTASAGSAGTAARSDHVHPAPTTISGNAGSATKLETAKTIALSGGATGTATSFDGSRDITIPVTALDATKLSGIIPIACIPKGALERIFVTTSDTTRLALTSNDVQAGDVVKVESTGLMYYIKDDTKLGTEDAFEPFTAGSAASVAWANITGKPTFSTVATSGRYSDLSGTPTIPVASAVAGSALGTASAGTSAAYARADHVHPLQTTVSGNAGTATKLATGVNIGLSGVTATAQSFDGSKAITIPITAVPAGIVTGLAAVATSGAYSDLSGRPTIPSASTTTPAALGTAAVGTATTYARADHVHAAPTSVANATNATTASKVANSMVVKLNGGSTEGTNMFTFNGSAAKSVNITPSAIGAAASSHGTHVTYGTSAPAAAGTASAGSASSVSRSDHVHPAQTTITGNAGSATKVNNNLVVKLNGGSTEGTNMFTFNGSAAKTVNITPSAIGAAASSHTHSYAGSASVGGAANSVANNMIVKFNGGTAEGANMFTFNGSAAKSIDISPAAIGAAPFSHGTHVIWSTETPEAAGMATAGTSPAVSRSDHVHPLQTTITGNAGSATKVNSSLVVKLNSGSTEGTNMFTFNGSAAKTVNITPSAIGAAASSHTHSGYVPTSGTTMTGKLIAQNNTDYTTKQMRNIFLIEDGADIPAGANGDIILTYVP